MMWSKLRQKIKQCITPELQDRIDIHCTVYHEANDGEVWITLDKNKIFGGGYSHWNNSYKPKHLIKEFSILWGFHKDFTSVDIKSEDVAQIMKLGIHETNHIRNSLANYLNTPFNESLCSNNPIYKAFALIDKRLGVRRFKTIVLEENEHPLVTIFYGLRKECFKRHIPRDTPSHALTP